MASPDEGLSSSLPPNSLRQFPMDDKGDDEAEDGRIRRLSAVEAEELAAAGRTPSPAAGTPSSSPHTSPAGGEAAKEVGAPPEPAVGVGGEGARSSPLAAPAPAAAGGTAGVGAPAPQVVARALATDFEAAPAEILERKAAGGAAFKAGQYEKAEEEYSTGLSFLEALAESGPKDETLSDLAAVLRLNRAMARLNIGKLSECVADCDAVLAAVGPNQKASLFRARALVQQEKLKAAFLSFQDALALGGGGAAAAHNGLRQTAESLGQLGERQWLREHRRY